MLVHRKHSSPLGAKVNRDFLWKLDIVTIKCMFLLFWKLEWYISFHTSCVLRNILKTNYAVFAAYAAYLFRPYRSNCKLSLMLTL